MGSMSAKGGLVQLCLVSVQGSRLEKGCPTLLGCGGISGLGVSCGLDVPPCVGEQVVVALAPPGASLGSVAAARVSNPCGLRLNHRGCHLDSPRLGGLLGLVSHGSAVVLGRRGLGRRAHLRTGRLIPRVRGLLTCSLPVLPSPGPATIMRQTSLKVLSSPTILCF